MKQHIDMGLTCIISSFRYAFSRTISDVFCALLNVFIISFLTRVRDSCSTDLVSNWGVCFGVRENGDYMYVPIN